MAWILLQGWTKCSKNRDPQRIFRLCDKSPPVDSRAVEDTVLKLIESKKVFLFQMYFCIYTHFILAKKKKSIYFSSLPKMSCLQHVHNLVCLLLGLPQIVLIVWRSFLFTKTFTQKCSSNCRRLEIWQPQTIFL